ncbi:LPXTG cell wall anchor domain-containing protein [Micromonospora sp. DT47]|uniref:LPXTG cell wall anchor domain-containing protein n=1 Tax=Micromonospora sp. DT47 TaxID=3393431 RepID=UPI003CEBAF40
MNRLKSPYRHVMAVTASALIGIAGALTLASPASAHHSEVKVTAECDTAAGEWVTTWTVNSYAPEKVNNFQFTKVEATSVVKGATTPFTIDGIAVSEADTFPHKVSEPVVGKARLSGDATEASLTVRARWDNKYEESSDRGASIKFSESCAKVVTPPPAEANPKATVAADCDGDVVVKLENGAEATKDASFTVTGTDGFTKTATVEAGEDTTITVPARNAERIKVTEAGQEEPLFDDQPAEAKDCVEPGEPTGSIQMTCDALIFQIENPKDGKTVTITLTPNKGEAQTLVVKPGETKTATFKAFEGLTVTPKAEGLDDSSPIAWEKPAECTTASPTAPPAGGGAGGPTLPKTGAPAALIGGGAAALLAAGAVLFVVARRRRVRFTA